MGAEELVAAAAQAAGAIEGNDLGAWAAKVRAAATAQVLIVADMAKLTEQLSSPDLKLWVRKITGVQKVGPSYTVFVEPPMESRAPGGQVTENSEIRTDYWDRPQTMYLKRVAEASVGRWAILYQCNDHEGEGAPAQGHRRVVHIEPLPSRATRAPAEPVAPPLSAPAATEPEPTPEPAPTAQPERPQPQVLAFAQWLRSLTGNHKAEVNAWLERFAVRDLAAMTDEQRRGLQALHDRIVAETRERESQQGAPSQPTPDAGPLDDLLASLDGVADDATIDGLDDADGVRAEWREAWKLLSGSQQSALRAIVKRPENKDKLRGRPANPLTVGDLRVLNPLMAEALASQGQAA
jgi:hypothetical protein